MIKIAAAAGAALLLVSCATPKSLHAVDSPGLGRAGESSRSDPENAEFNALINAISKDSVLLAEKSREFNLIEGGLGLAVLAAASYGAFNTAFAGDNLKDAAFAAASLGALGSWLKPGDRRNAYAKASAQLKCLYEHGQVFAAGALSSERKTLPFAVSNTGSIDLSITPGGEIDVDRLVNALSAFAPENDKLPDKGSISVAEARLAIAASRQRTMAYNALTSLVSAKTSEDQIFKQRFAIVSAKYLEIVGALYQSNRFSAQSYEASRKAIADAAAKAAETKKNVEQGVKTLSLLTTSSVDSLAGLEEPMKKYAEAKAAITTCNAAAN